MKTTIYCIKGEENEFLSLSLSLWENKRYCFKFVKYFTKNLVMAFIINIIFQWNCQSQVDNTVQNQGQTLTQQQLAERRLKEKQSVEESLRYLNDLMKEMENEAIKLNAVRPKQNPEDYVKKVNEIYQQKVQNYLNYYTKWKHNGIYDINGMPTTRRGWIEAKQRNALQTLNNMRRAESDEQLEVEIWKILNNDSGELKLPNGSAARLKRILNGNPIFVAPFSLNAADTISTDEVWPGGSTGLNLTGANLLVGIWDEYNVRSSHFEFMFPGPATRIIQKDYTQYIGGHATAVAGVIAAYGINWGPPYGRIVAGMSQNAIVWAYDFYANEFQELVEASIEGLRLSNHSYGIMGGWYNFNNTWYWFGDTSINEEEDYKFGYYSVDTQRYDQQIYENPEYLMVFAVGNDQREGPVNQPVKHKVWNINYWDDSDRIRPLDGDEGGFDTISINATAKNVLSVGAVNDIIGGYNGPNSVILANFSSCGPTDDGRIKPDVVANGVMLNVVAHTADNKYWIDQNSVSGTSFSAPCVTGSINLLIERYYELHPGAPRLLASTLKGLVIHTADEAGLYPGPDFRYGWGLMNTLNAVQLINNDASSGSHSHLKETLLENGGAIEFPIFCDGKVPLRVTICWTDPPGPIDQILTLDPQTPRLVNDIDLRVISPNGMTNFPWVLDPDLNNESSARRSAPAITGDNTRDNIEQIYIANPGAGVYIVRITHKGILYNNEAQWVSIFISGNIPQPKPQLKILHQFITPEGKLALIWNSVVGQRYQVQYKDKIDDNLWLNIGPEISASKTNVLFEIPIDQNQNQRFFRVIETQ
ncbi:MAG: S8 family serine peptidase [Verrucomicrobiia bacterium]